MKDIINKFFDNKNFVILVRVVLGGLFIYSSLDKIANMPDFARIIYNYKILPIQLVNLPAIFLPWLEFITGLCLVLGKFLRGALLIYSSLLVIFTVALAHALIKGLDIACGCFSVKPSTTTEVWLRIILDLIMLFFSVELYLHVADELKTKEELS
jgi:uncharacterized membrane protein YphA (DoxX/SURF4 family)